MYGLRYKYQYGDRVLGVRTVVVIEASCFVSLSITVFIVTGGRERRGAPNFLLAVSASGRGDSGEALPRRAQSGLMWPPGARPKFGATRELTGVKWYW